MHWTSFNDFRAAVSGLEEVLTEWGRNSPRGRFIHASLGHEFGAWLASRYFPIEQSRWCFYYRSHAWALAAGCAVDEIVASVTGHPDPASSSMHLMLKPNIIDCNSIVAAQYPIAVGAAFADRRSPVICAGGDGSTNTGPFFEALNLARRHDLSVLFVIEDNGIQIGTPYEQTSAVPIETKVSGFGVPTLVETAPFSDKSVERLLPSVARLSGGPVVLVLRAERCCAHMAAGDPENGDTTRMPLSPDSSVWFERVRDAARVSVMRVGR